MSKQWVHVEKKSGYAVLTLCREPVNSMNLDVWEQLTSALTECEQDKSVRGLIIQSGLKKHIFSAGNDLNELYAPKTSQQRYEKFWSVSNKFLAQLYSSPLVTIAAIKGACPAGGCVIALCCDYRIMTADDKSSIGLNEVALGIPVPKYWTEVMKSTIGHRRAEYILQRALQPVASEALKLGLIDAAVPAEQLLSSAEAEMKKWLALQDAGRIVTKEWLRAQTSKEWVEFTANEGTTAWTRLSSESTVKSLAAVIARLSGGKKQAAKL